MCPSCQIVVLKANCGSLMVEIKLHSLAKLPVSPAWPSGFTPMVSFTYFLFIVLSMLCVHALCPLLCLLYFHHGLHISTHFLLYSLPLLWRDAPFSSVLPFMNLLSHPVLLCGSPSILPLISCYICNSYTAESALFITFPSVLTSAGMESAFFLISTLLDLFSTFRLQRFPNKNMIRQGMENK